MDSGIQTRQSNILRVGKDLLVLLEITVLGNKNAGNVSWFTDIEKSELLMLVRDPVCKRVEEYGQHQPEFRRKRKGTLLKNSEVKVQPPAMITGQRVKLGVQFMKHHISRTCLLPKQCQGPATTADESSNHSGGGFDLLCLFPEKLQVVVCEYMPATGTSMENQQTSTYFETTTSSSDKTQTNTAKKKQLQLKRIVSSSSSFSVLKKSTLRGGFETSLIPCNRSSTPSSPTCRQEQGKEKPDPLKKASPSSSENKMAAKRDVDKTSVREGKIRSEDARDDYLFESESEQGKIELELTPQTEEAKVSERCNPEKDSPAVSIPCQSSSNKRLLNSHGNGESLDKSYTLKSDERDGPRQSKLSLNREKSKDDMTELESVVSVALEQTTCVKSLDSGTLSTENPVDPGVQANSSLSGNKRKLETSNCDDSAAEQVPKPTKEQTHSTIPESCSSPVMFGKSEQHAANGRKRRRKLSKKLIKIRRMLEISSSSDEEESFNIDVFRLLKKKRKKTGQKSLLNSESGIPTESVKETEAVAGKHDGQSDNALNSDEDTLPSASFLKGTGALAQKETEKESSNDGRVSPTFDRLTKNTKKDGGSKFRKQPRSSQFQGMLRRKGSQEKNRDSAMTGLSDIKRDGKSDKGIIPRSDSDEPLPVYLSEESRETNKGDVISKTEHSDGEDRLDQNETHTGTSSFNIARKCLSPLSDCWNDEERQRRKEKVVSQGERESFDESNLKDKTDKNSLDSDDDSLPEFETGKQSDHQSVNKADVAAGQKVFSFHEKSKYCIEDKPLQEEDREKENALEVSSKHSQEDYISDDNQQENVCSSPGLKKLTSKKQNFFQVDEYENVQSQSDGISFDMKFNKVSRKKKAPLRAKNVHNPGTFGSLKQFDDTTVSKKSRNSKQKNRRCSQIEVTPQNLDKWWLPKDGKKKERKSDLVVDLVAMEEKIEGALKLVKSVSELTEEQLIHLTQNNEDYLKAIFQGKKPCHRHQEYKSSSALRTRMTYLVSYGDFPEDSLETIMDTLVPMFCKKGSKYLDYVSKVLLPELLVKICMDVLHVSYEEAEKMF